MTIIPGRVAQLDGLRLDSGPHTTFDDGHCAMEVVAWLAGEGHTDAPDCASVVLREFTIGINDRWGDAQRQRLVPFLPRMVGTAGDGKDEARSYMALDWLIRTFTPAWLDLAGHGESAAELRELRPITDLAAAQAAGPVVRDIKHTAAAAAWAAAPPGGAWTAAAHATWDAAGDAAGDAAAVAWDADWDAAEEGAWDAARDAAWKAAATGTPLRPTIDALQDSALDLLDRMIDAV